MDVEHIGTISNQDPADQQSTMTLKGIAFRTHQREAHTHTAGLHAPESFLKQR
jgi:hypothetical protein